MSGERPAPLWPEGISKVRPVENQKPKALTEGVAVPVAKQPELSKPDEQTGENPVLKHVDELKWQASLKGEPAPLQPIPAEQQASERLGKPPPQEVHKGPLSGPGSQGNGREAPESQQARKSNFPNFSKELFLSQILSERFGVLLEEYRAIARGIYGKGVDIDNLTEEQKAKVEAVHRGFNQGWKKGVERFFKERKANE